MYYRLSFVLISTISLLLLHACGGSDSSIPAEQASPNTPTVDQVKSHYVDMAFAAYSDSLSTAEALRNTVSDFLASPTEENLQTARAAYKEARIPYQQSEIMRWDTTITLDKNLADEGGPASVDEWEGQVNAWPLDENFIDTIIAGDSEITKQLLINQNSANDNEANVTTGVHAVEYMLWGEDTNGTGPGAGQRPASDFALGDACVDDLCERRSAYLSMAIELLVDDLTAMEAEWSNTARNTIGTLANNFLSSDNAIDYIVVSLYNMSGTELAGARMSAGLSLGDPEESHDCFSDLSHVAIYNNFQGIRNAFYGRYNTMDGPSIGDLLREADTSTYDRIDTALNDIEVQMKQILDAGEREINPIRFDQIIGQAADGTERQIAIAAATALSNLQRTFDDVRQVLELSNIGFEDDGD